MNAQDRRKKRRELRRSLTDEDCALLMLVAMGRVKYHPGKDGYYMFFVGEENVTDHLNDLHRRYLIMWSDFATRLVVTDHARRLLGTKS